MATILRAPGRLTAAQKKATTTLFLAGPFEDGDGGPDAARSWRDDVIDAFTDLDITIVDPRNERWPSLEAGSPGRRGAYASPYGDRRATRGPSARTDGPVYHPEDEDQSAHASGVKLGMRVRHQQFGVGTVLGIEDHGDDVKLTVRFGSGGVKRLLGKYARLERA